MGHQEHVDRVKLRPCTQVQNDDISPKPGFGPYDGIVDLPHGSRINRTFAPPPFAACAWNQGAPLQRSLQKNIFKSFLTGDHDIRQRHAARINAKVCMKVGATKIEVKANHFEPTPDKLCCEIRTEKALTNPTLAASN